MAFAIADRVWEQASHAGTGAVTLPASAVAGGYQSFLAGWGASGSGPYVIFGGGQWEVGEGSINIGGTSLTRTAGQVSAGSSGAGALVNFTAGVKNIISEVSAAIVQSILSSIHGQCRLSKSGANLLLSPLNGNKLVVAGVLCTIPDAGVTLAPTALTPGTVYYIYATASAARAINALEASTTAHTPSTAANNKGVEVKSGDEARTLVGMARPITGPAWADTAAQRFVRSWFNDAGVQLYSPSTTGTITATAATEISAAMRAEALFWANEGINASFSGFGFNNTATAVLAAGIGLGDVGAAALQNPEAVTQSAGANLSNNLCNSWQGTVSEGYHYLTTMARVTAATTGTISAGRLGATTSGQ